MGEHGKAWQVNPAEEVQRASKKDARGWALAKDLLGESDPGGAAAKGTLENAQAEKRGRQRGPQQRAEGNEGRAKGEGVWETPKSDTHTSQQTGSPTVDPDKEQVGFGNHEMSLALQEVKETPDQLWVRIGLFADMLRNIQVAMVRGSLTTVALVRGSLTTVVQVAMSSGLHGLLISKTGWLDPLGTEGEGYAGPLGIQEIVLDYSARDAMRPWAKGKTQRRGRLTTPGSGNNPRTPMHGPGVSGSKRDPRIQSSDGHGNTKATVAWNSQALRN